VLATQNRFRLSMTPFVYFRGSVLLLRRKRSTKIHEMHEAMTNDKWKMKDTYSQNPLTVTESSCLGGDRPVYSGSRQAVITVVDNR